METSRLNSILRGSNGQVFRTILTYYKPEPCWVLDCTTGYKHFWDELAVNTSTLGVNALRESYKVVFSDRRRIADIQADYRWMPLKDHSVDVVVYDPPYVPITLKVNGYEKWLEGDRYATDEPKIDENMMQMWAKEAYRVAKRGGIAIVKLQDTVNFWHFKFYNRCRPWEVEALYIHDLERNWAENVVVKNARKPIPLHAYWFVLAK